MSLPLPFGPIRTAIYRRLTGADGLGPLTDGGSEVPVRVQRPATGDPPAPLVLIERPPTPAEGRGDIKADTGHVLTQRLRVHTRFPKAGADLSVAERIAQKANALIRDTDLQPDGDLRVVHWPVPGVTPQTYTDGGEVAVDILLDYELLTQTLPTT